MNAPDAVDALRPIGLTELAERAELLQRVDRKYVVPIADLPPLIGALSTGARVLEIDGRRSFGYRSVYFDTADLLSYRLTALRRRRRFKIRTRHYLDSGLQLLEVKTRGPRGVTIKQRVPYAGAGDLTAVDQLAAITALRAVGAAVPAADRALGPVITTEYRRTTLFLTDTATRVTLDTDLSWVHAGRCRRLGPYAIVETKTSNHAAAMDHLLWRARRRPTSFSKFGTGLAAVRPDLPAHRWRASLDRFLEPQESAA